MRKYPTPWQYLVDIVAQARLKAAYANGDAKARAAADKCFRGLTEDEVVFEPLAARKDGKLGYSMTCKVRGFKLNELTFATGTLSKMIVQNANLMAQHEDLETSQITGFYFCPDADQLHLLVHPNSNIHEALKMTGYEFQPEHYTSELYSKRDDVLQANGAVTIKHPVVAGDIYITYVQAPKTPLEQLRERSDAGEDVVNHDFFKQDADLSKAPLIDETQGGQFGADTSETTSEEKVIIPPVVNPVIVKEEPAPEAPAEEPVVQIQKKKK